LKNKSHSTICLTGIRHWNFYGMIWQMKITRLILFLK